jgi:hypothetical protein
MDNSLIKKVWTNAKSGAIPELNETMFQYRVRQRFVVEGLNLIKYRQAQRIRLNSPKIYGRQD